MLGFVSYSHTDRKICNELRKQLAAICRIFPIQEFWVDDITPTGRCFRKGYGEAIEAASIHILLISSSYLWSTEIMDHELPMINRKSERDKDLVLPIIVDDCLWESAIGSLLASPRDDMLNLRPLLRWRPMRDGFTRTGRQISHAISKHFDMTPRQMFEWNSS